MDPKRPLFPIYDIMEHWQAFAYATPEVRPVHHALYYALVQMCKRRGGSHRFNLHYQEGMQACGIAARNTYVAALRELEGWGFVVYTPGANALRAAIVDVKFCACAEQALSMYRASNYTSGDASTEHIIKEVKGLREDVEEKAASIERLEKELAELKAKQAQTPAANPAKQQALASTDPDEEQRWDVGPLTKPHPFKVICERLGFLEIDFELYRKQALAAAESGNVSRTIKQWEGWVRNFLNNQMKHGPLLKAAAVDLSRATPRHELPPPGSDCTGRHIVLPNTGDANLNRIAAQTYTKNFPNATIHHTRP